MRTLIKLLQTLRPLRRPTIRLTEPGWWRIEITKDSRRVERIGQ